jgi:hypothetical protein
MPKPNQIAKMIAKAEELIAKMNEQLASEGGMTPEAEAEALETIEDQLAKIERLQALTVRVKAIKAAK